jgi:phenylalanyl-tRNA synthetase beta chain
VKVSLNLAQNFSNVDLKNIPKNELLKRIGAQLGAVEDVIDWASKFDGAVIAKVVTCEKHHDADKLSICRIDDGGKRADVERGEDGLIQVVCGAPNVHADMFTVWLAPGVTVPSTRDSDPFILEAREIRGVISNGMLASASELGISDDHQGILEVLPEEIGKEPALGSPFSKYFDIDDFVVNCENKMFTHRPDCFGNLGVARELAGISGLEFKSPGWYINQPKFESKKGLSLTVKNEITDLVPRFMAVAMDNVNIMPSPVWLQALLTRVGIKPINNVVDITNFAMHLTGQPLHAFDYDKLKTGSRSVSLMPRLSVKGEKLTLLSQKEIELTGEEIVIATDKRAVGLAGVMGGAETEVDETTKRIVIEAATFDMYSIRRTSMNYGLFTEAVTRFNKGQSPYQNDRVLAFAMEQMTQYASADQASNVFDIKAELPKPRPIIVSAHFINDRLGTELRPADIAEYLKNIEFETEITDTPNGVKIAVIPPFWRMDIKLPEDIVEETGRLHGYDKLPVALPLRSSKPTPKNGLFEFKYHLRKQLREAGANELLTYSFVHGDLLKKTGTDPEKWAYHIRNAISPELQYYRTSLIPSLLSKVHPNIKAQAGSEDNIFGLFEIGKVHVKGDTDEDKLPKQHERLALIIAADEKTASSHQYGAAYYYAKKYLDHITDGLCRVTDIENDEYPIASLYQKGRSGLVFMEEDVVAVIGEFTSEVRQSLKLPQFSAGFEVDIALLQSHLKPKKYHSLPLYPGTELDITLEVDNSTNYAAIWQALNEISSQAAASKGFLLSLEPLTLFSPDDSHKKRFTFRFNISHPTKTLVTEEANALLDSIAKAIRESHEAIRI